MAKILKIAAVIVGALAILYVFAATALTVSHVCPATIHLTPAIRSNEDQKKQLPAWYVFCPLAKKN